MSDRAQDFPVSVREPFEGLSITAEDLIDEIGAAFVEHNQPPENSFTLADFVALKNATSETTAYRYLERLVMQGKLGKTQIGKKNYYHRIEK